MPIVQLQILAGRSSSMKAQVCREIADVLERTLAAPRSSIRVLITELAPEHWSVGGVTKADEVTLTEPGDLR